MSKKQATLADYVSSHEAARIIGCSPQHVAYLCRHGRLRNRVLSPRVRLVERKAAREYAKQRRRRNSRQRY